MTKATTTKRRLTAASVVLCLLLAIGYFVIVAFSTSEIPAQGPLADVWGQHRNRIVEDASISRYYRFQDVAADRGRFNNSAGWGGDLEIAPSDSAEPVFRSTEGRWPWKKAVRLDQIPLESRPLIVQNRSFSLEAWIRHHGPGMVSGGNYEHAGTLLAIGDGVWSGWRLIMLYPCNALVFEIGRPKPNPAIGVAVFSRVPPQVWTHVACTWDGKQISIYANGLLSGRTPYSGEFHQVKSHSKFRVGYVGNGLGSVRFDIDELAVYDRCLSAPEVLQNAWFQHSIRAEVLTEFETAGEHLVSRQLDDALSAYRGLIQAPSLPGDIRALAQIRSAECLREKHEYDQAMLVFSEVATSEVLSDTCRRTAMHESLALKEGVTAEKYQPVQAESLKDGIDHYRLCQSCAEYDRTIDSFRQVLADQDAVRWMRQFETEIQPILRNRCWDCHQTRKAKGNLDLTRFATGEMAGEEGEVWAHIAARVQKGEMPPPGRPQLTDHEKELLRIWVESRPKAAFCEELATEENQRHFTGHVLSRRLTRTEYRNAIHDLLGEALRADEEPPVDGSGGEGFDTVGDVLFTSTSHLQAYLRAAHGVVERSLERELNDTVSSPKQLLVALPNQLDPSSNRTDAQAAAQILAAFGRRAWRRPIDPVELQQLLGLFDQAQKSGQDFRTALAEPLKAVLVSPHFLFVVEIEPPGAGVQRLTPFQLATRLALFLWSSIPDEELLQTAESGQVYDDQVLRSQMRRMLQDPKSRALGESFGLQWLGLSGDSDRTPDPEVFPEFSADLAEDMREEAIRFVARIFQDDRPVTELIDTDYVIVNSRLAKHYELNVPTESLWKLVHVSDQRRGGVLTLGGVLTASSRARRTSPVLRGKWILHQLLGSYVSPPPAGVPALEASSTSEQQLTMRQRLERHRTQSDCAACHQTMDPLGFSLENYDAIGRWRDWDDGLPVDASGILPTGESVNGPAGLKQAILNRSQEFHRHFVRKLMGFALGRGLDRFDDCLVERCLKHLRENNFRASVLVEEIGRSYAFQYRYFKPSLP